MTRRSSVLTFVLVLFGAMTVAVPAAVSDGYESISAITGGSGTSSEPVDRLPAPDTYLAQLGTAPDRDYSSVSAITGPPLREPTVVPGSPAGSDDGFDWGDALIGALTAAGLMLITLAAARSVARHRGATAESRA